MAEIRKSPQLIYWLSLGLAGVAATHEEEEEEEKREKEADAVEVITL